MSHKLLCYCRFLDSEVIYIFPEILHICLPIFGDGMLAAFCRSCKTSHLSCNIMILWNNNFQILSCCCCFFFFLNGVCCISQTVIMFSLPFLIHHWVFCELCGKCSWEQPAWVHALGLRYPMAWYVMFLYWNHYYYYLYFGGRCASKSDI